jgi:hypothetical protein
MIITKEEIYKKAKKELRSKFPDDFIFQSRNKLWDFSVYTLDDDRHYKLVFEHDKIQILSIKNFLKGNVILNSRVDRKYFILYVQSDFTFKYIRIV